MLDQSGGGRGKCNRWRVADPRSLSAVPSPSQSAPPPALAPPQLPLVALARPLVPPADGEPVRSPGVAPGSGIPGINPGQISTSAVPETPAQTPAETPAPFARVGTESRNQRTTPPVPPEGGRRSGVEIREPFTTDRGRRRLRTVVADSSELRPLAVGDRDVWQEMRGVLRQQLGDGPFEVWFASVDLVAASAVDGALLLASEDPVLLPWLRVRWAPLLVGLSQRFGQPLRIATDRELAIRAATARDGVQPSDLSVNTDRQEAV